MPGSEMLARIASIIGPETCTTSAAFERLAEMQK